MPQRTIEQIRKWLAEDPSIPDEKKHELLGLLEKLQEEIAALDNKHKEDAGRIAMFAASSTHEAIRKIKNRELLNISIDGLRASVRKFETTHPRLVQIVNSICTTLSNLGI